MRKRSVRNGLWSVMAALALIIMATFYHAQISDFFSFSASVENRMYRIAMVWAAVLGGYGVVITAIGCVQSHLKNETHIKVLPAFIGVFALIVLFFFLMSELVNAPPRENRRRLRSGETITI